MNLNLQTVVEAIDILNHETIEEAGAINKEMRELEKKQVAIVINVPTVVYVDERGDLIDVIDNSEALMFHCELAKETIENQFVTPLIDKVEENYHEQQTNIKRKETIIEKKLA